MAQTTTTNTLFNIQNALGSRSRNISDAKAVGGFAVDPVFISQTSTGLGGGSKLVQRNDFISKGDFVQTGNQSDLSIGGVGTTGLFTVKRQNGDIAYSANGSMRLDEGKKLYLADGSAVMGWQFDAAGNLPTNTSTTSSLTPLSLQGVTSKAIPTTNVGLVMNLKESQATLAGPGGKMDLTVSGAAKASSSTDIITPGTNGAATLHMGDQFILQATPGGAASTKFQYGGIAMSSAISVSNVMYGSSTTGGQFNISVPGTPPIANQLAYNQGFSITVSGGSTYTFYANPSLGLSGQNYFNSITSLASAIQQQSGLRAKVGDDGRLCISASDANQGLTFADVSLPAAPGTSIISTLGLDPVQTNAVAGLSRFATMQELQQKMGSVSQGFKSTINGVGIDFSAASPLSTLSIDGNAANIQPIYRAKAGRITAPAVNPNSTTQLANAATIQSNNHGLNVGDYVRLVGGPGNAIVAGTYRVNAVTNDSFEIGVNTPIVGANLVGGVVAQGAAFANIPTNGSFTWQKIDGGVGALPTTSVAAAAAATIATNVGGGTAQIAGLVHGTLGLQYQMAIGDVVYIQGSVALQDGYYTVTAPGTAQGFSVAYTAGGGFGQPDSDLKIAAAAAAADTGIRITKVAARAGAAAGGLDTLPLVATAATQNITINVTAGTSANVGDVIAFRNLTGGFGGNATVVGLGLSAGNVAQLSITQDKFYTVTAVGAGTITFQADLATGIANAAAVTASSTGFLNTQIAGGGALAQVAGTTLGAGAYVDYISREFNALGVAVNAGAGTTTVTSTLLSTPLQATYSATDVTRNFSNGAVTKNVINQSVTVIDSLGASHTITLAFGKTGPQQWNVEIYLPKNPDGTYDGTVNNQLLANSGLLVAGQLKFDGNGQLISVDNTLAGAISVNWTNGATSKPFLINWGAVNGLLNGVPAPAGVTQIDSNVGVSSITNDGKVPGSLNGYEFDEKGILYATFDNGTTIKVAQVAIATFSNFNGLSQKDGYLYESADSGAVLLKTAGVGGVGQINIGGVTSSAVNDTGEYLDVIDLSQASAMAVNVAAKVNATRDQLVNNLAR